MYLRDSMELNNQEQIAYLVTLAHDEFLEQTIDDCLEPRDEPFDEWLPFIGKCALQMSVPRQRNEQ